MRTSFSSTPALVAAVLLAILPVTPAAAQDFNRQSLPANGIDAGNWFGRAVAIDGNYAVVARRSTAHFYAWNGTQWYEDQVISSTENSFGSSVAVSGNCAVVGATGAGIGLYQDAGEAYVYCRTGTEGNPWVLAKTLHASDPENDAGFGSDVDFDGDYILVGANKGGASDDVFAQTGSAYVFYRNQGGTNNWGLQKKLNAPDEDSGDEFGRSVAIKGAWILVGAPEKGPGAAYVFGRNVGGTNAWGVLKSLHPDAPSDSNARFGHATAIGDGFAVVSAPGEDAPDDGSGQIYAYKTDLGAWTESDRRAGSDTGFLDGFGSDVAISGDFVLVGAAEWDGPGGELYYDRGTAYLFEWNGSSLSEEATLLGNNNGFAWFGDAVGLSDGKAIVGAYGDKAQGNEAGAAFAFVLLPETPSNFQASDGSSIQNISLSWAKVTGADGYRIYIDGGVSPIAEPPGLSYSDARPSGEVHTYAIRAYNSIGESAQASDIGRTRSNGQIRGSVTSSFGTGVPGTRVTIEPYGNNSVSFDGVDDYIEIEHTDALNVSDQFIIEAWVKPDVVTGRHAVFSTRRFNDEGGFQLEIGGGSSPSGSGRIAVSTKNDWVFESQNGVVPAGEWSHLRFVRFTNGTTNFTLVYVNGEYVSGTAKSMTLIDNDSPKLIGAGLNLSHFFDGEIDEVRLWDRDEMDLSLAEFTPNFLYERLEGSLPGLVGYWRLDPERGDIVTDYAEGSHGLLQNGAAFSATDPAPVSLSDLTDTDGAYELGSINYGDGTTYTVTPVLEGHTFDPISRTDVYLDENAPSKSGINFTDPTALIISGQITFDIGGCPQPGVDILLNGTVGATTDENGNFSLTVLDPSSVEVTPSYGEHAFEPASVSYSNMTESVADVAFTNVETRTLDGRVVGGDCGLALGSVTVNLYGMGGCSLTREVDADAQGNYLISDLPALDSVTVEAHVTDDPLIQFAPKQVPLAAADTTADFIYRAPPQITLRGFPEPVGSCGMTVMEQLDTYGFYVDVVEVYGGQICPVETGHLVIRNSIADDESPDTLALNPEGAYYEFMAGEPNITGGGAHPYQKNLSIEAVTGGGPQAGPYGYSETLENWVLVEGNRPREKTFATVTPEIPLLILRDPPGDQSYSYVSEGTSTCTTLGFSTLTDDGSNAWGKVKLGNAFSIGGGAFITVSTDVAYWGEIGGSMETGSTQLNLTDTQLCLTATETFSTSNSNLITGSKGDVFVGGAMNFLYALTDVLEFDEATCQIKLSQDVIFAPGQFATTYMYTEDHVEANLIPRLQGLANNPNTPADSVAYLRDQIEVWEQTLATNDDLKESATFIENRSFSSGTAYESSTTSSSTTSNSIEFNTYIDQEIAVEAGLEVAGAGISGGYQVRMRTEEGERTDTTETTTNTVGYVLADDDPGDYFSVDILSDPVHGTPVFKTVSGESSCLWEEGTRPRDVVQLQAETSVLSGIDPDEPASFQITLSNPSQSETDPNRQFYVAPLQETNPDGATLRLNGDPFSDGLRLTVPTRGSVSAILSVERGPEAFSYEDLKIMAYPECEYTAWQNSAPMQIADTLDVTVHFENACSPVTMNLPENGWIVNAASGNIVQVVASDYDRAALSNLKLQYSPADKNDWTTATLIAQSELPDGEVLIEWDVSDVLDGAYKLRIAATCSEGTNYSASSTGVIDRAAPVVLGPPTPADGIFHVGDKISVAFNEPLDCSPFDESAVVLTAKETGETLERQVLCKDNGIRIVPDSAAAALAENQTIQATVLTVADAAGNTLAEPYGWTFRFNTNPVHWENAFLADNVVEGETPLLSAYLANDSGADESFTLSGYPTWLTPDVTSGTLPPEGSRAVVFTLDGNLAQGTYRDTVLAQTSRGDEPLYVEIAVQCPGPGWSFTEADAAQFAGSMNLISGFYIDQIPFLGENDLVGAFVGDELRGLAEAIRVLPQDEYAAFLNVYSNSDGETVNFRVWDASECIQRDVAATRTFEAGTVRGSTASLDSLSVSGAVLQSIALNDGWTWMSLGVESTDMTAETVLDRVRPTEGNVIKGQTSFAQYVVGHGWVGTLSSLAPGVMYQILLDSAQALEFIGEPIVPEDRPLEVSAGWNWLGYLPDEPLPPATALESFSFAEGDRLIGQTQSLDYSAAGWQGTLSMMRPGEGYLLHLEEGGTITYPGATGKVQKSGSGVISYAGKQGGPIWSVDTRDYEKVMTVTGTIQVDGLPLAGAGNVIGAFVDGEVRGLAAPKFVLDQWLYFVPVYSNKEGETVTFQVYDANQAEAAQLAEYFTFQSTAAHGTPREPVVFNTGNPVGLAVTPDPQIPTRYELSSNYPNPFNPTTQIRYAIKERASVELTVFNILGQEVLRMVDQEQAPGWYTVTFDAAHLASGVYFYHLEAGDFVKTRKMTLVK